MLQEEPLIRVSYKNISLPGSMPLFFYLSYENLIMNVDYDDFLPWFKKCRLCKEELLILVLL